MVFGVNSAKMTPRKHSGAGISHNWERSFVAWAFKDQEEGEDPLCLLVSALLLMALKQACGETQMEKCPLLNSGSYSRLPWGTCMSPYIT